MWYISGSTASRQQLNKLFPDTPTSGETLETQQRALLLAQEDQLGKIKKGGRECIISTQKTSLT